MKRMMIAASLALATAGAPVWAQPADPHHPGQSAAPAQPAAPPAAQHGSMRGGMPMMNMMGGSMPMMNMMGGGMPMMNMMHMMGSGMAGMNTIDRIEGRIAFLRTELRITEAQASTWNAFADALRANAKGLGEVRGSMMPQTGAPATAALAARLDLQERWLVARLEGTRMIKAAFTNLYGALSDEQRKTADELLAAHMGVGTMPMMGMRMMPMMSGQMQPGPAAPQPTPPSK